MKLKCQMLLLIGLLIFGGATFAAAQSKTSNPPQPKKTNKTSGEKGKSRVKFVNPDTMPKSFGYSYVVIAEKGRTIYLSGQVALDREGKVVGRGDFRAQTVQVFENLKAGLEAAGASFKDVVKINIYLTDINSQLNIFREVRDKYINLENPPASSLVEVRRLVGEDFLIEIDAVAFLPE